MWPILLDMTEEESVQGLRHLELEAYSSLVSALRAQGTLNPDKRRILKETSVLLNISSERHKAEIRRAISDERLNTIAYHNSGRKNSLEDWAYEGRRVVPLLPRALPQTSYSLIADEACEAGINYNKQLPLPVNTERKRSPPQPATPVSVNERNNCKSPTFRLPEAPRDEPKRRKCNSVGEGSSLAQHLLGPKLTKIQQIYRQVSSVPKVKARELPPESENKDLIRSRPNGIPHQNPPIFQQSKVNVIQNISIPPQKTDVTIKQSEMAKESLFNPLPLTEIQTIVPRSLTLTPSLVPNNTQTSLNVSEVNITNAPKKAISVGQKVIVVSNSQTLPTNSILQKTLSVPRNKLQKLNLDNYKIVPNPIAHQISSPPAVPVTGQNPIASKPKLVTIKGTSNKKMISLSKLQMFNPKANLKVIPYDGKLNNVHSKQPEQNILKIPVTSAEESRCRVEVLRIETPNMELNGYLENGGMKPSNEIESNGDDFSIERENGELYLGGSETLMSSESSETDERRSNGDSSTESMDESSDFTERHHDGEILQEFEVHTDDLLH